jgi:hypothetical protein
MVREGEIPKTQNLEAGTSNARGYGLKDVCRWTDGTNAAVESGRDGI